MAQHARLKIEVVCEFISAILTAHGNGAPTRALNGLLRQYFPKGTDLEHGHSANEYRSRGRRPQSVVEDARSQDTRRGAYWFLLSSEKIVL